MVVSNDNIDAERGGMLYWSDISCSAIDGDYEFDIFYCKLIEKIILEPITIMYSVRESI
jgi:hypothetical protein